MSSTKTPVIRIKHPTAVFTANDLDAVGGIVVHGGRIVELLGMGEEPVTPAATVFDASPTYGTDRRTDERHLQPSRRAMYW